MIASYILILCHCARYIPLINHKHYQSPSEHILIYFEIFHTLKYDMLFLTNICDCFHADIYVHKIKRGKSMSIARISSDHSPDIVRQNFRLVRLAEVNHRCDKGHSCDEPTEMNHFPRNRNNFPRNFSKQIIVNEWSNDKYAKREIHRTKVDINSSRICFDPQ